MEGFCQGDSRAEVNVLSKPLCYGGLAGELVSGPANQVIATLSCQSQ
jgi:hypothetical protein